MFDVNCVCYERRVAKGGGGGAISALRVVARPRRKKVSMTGND